MDASWKMTATYKFLHNLAEADEEDKTRRYRIFITWDDIFFPKPKLNFHRDKHL